MIINSKFYSIPSDSVKQKIDSNVKLVIYSPSLTDAEAGLLNKILSATGLESTNILHIIIENDDIPVKYLLDQVSGLKIISFDCGLKALGLQANVKKYQRFMLQTAELVKVDSLSAIASQQPLKVYLWNLLKEWFIHE